MESVSIRRYSDAFKQSIVREYEAGASISSLGRKYGITGNSTIKRWVGQFGRYGTRHNLMVIQTPEERNRITELEQRIADLEHALADAQLDRLMLSACLTVAEEQYGVDVKKTRAQISSKQHKRKQKKSK